MCTLIVCSRIFDDAPLLVAANRDERYDRPAEGHSRRQVGGRQVLAPRDLVAGGTWIGLNDQGVFVGITNRFSGPPDSARRSRGEIVEIALGHAEVDEAARAIGWLDPVEFNPFHLVIADKDHLRVVWGDGARIQREEPPPGPLVITERSLGAAPTQRDALLHQALDDLGPERPPDAFWADLLRTHAEPTFEGVCVHWDDRGYGTRSSTLLRLDARGEPTLLTADGPPCTSPLTDRSELARGLLAASE